MSNAFCIAGMAAMLAAYAAAAVSAARHAPAAAETYHCQGADEGSLGARLTLELGENSYKLRGVSAGLGRVDCAGRAAGESLDPKAVRFEAKACGVDSMLVAKRLIAQGSGTVLLLRGARAPSTVSHLAYNCGP